MGEFWASLKSACRGLERARHRHTGSQTCLQREANFCFFFFFANNYNGTILGK